IPDAAAQESGIVEERPDGTVVVVENGTAELGDKNKAETKEEAKARAMRKAVDLSVGAFLTSSTTVENYQLVHDQVTTAGRAFVRSIEELDYTYDAASETGVYVGRFVVDRAQMEEFVKQATESEQAAQEQIKEDLRVQFALFSMDGRRWMDGTTVHSGDRFRMMVQVEPDAYVYIINKDASGQVFTLFPNSAITSVVNPLPSGVEHFIPGSDQALELDEQTGVEVVYVVASLTPMEELPRLTEQLATADLSGEQRDEALHAGLQTRGIQIVDRYDGPVTQKSTEQNSFSVEMLEGEGRIVREIRLDHR
ncbi:DUF4384 domain-containing protein, partial [bacterium]|nr:DUF4384 domain-containing protein [bacterium]